MAEDIKKLIGDHQRRMAGQRATDAARLAADAQAWRPAMDRLRQALVTAAATLEARGVPRHPVLTNKRRRLFPVTGVDRTAVTGFFWHLGWFVLDPDGRAYRPARLERLDRTWLTIDHAMVKKQVKRSCLRTGLSPDSMVCWRPVPIELDPAEAARTGTVGGVFAFQHHTPSGTLMVLPPQPDDHPVNLDTLIARAIVQHVNGD